MATLTYKSVTLGGVDPAHSAADALGDLLPAHAHGFLSVKNGGASPITVTIVTPGDTEFGIAQPDVTISVPAAGERLIGPLTERLLDPIDKAVKVSYSGVTSVTRAAIYV